jgi:hypothetical protein
MKKNDLLIYKLFLLFQLLIYVTAFILCIWTSKLIRIIFYLSFVIISFSCIYSFIFVYISFDLKIDYSHKTKLFNYTYKLFGILNLIIEILIFCCKFFQYLNDIHYGKYLKNCPFSLSSDLFSNNISYYEKRRCELYNIYTNSRYKYQYICSYNASKDFENDKSDNGLDKIICTPKMSNISNNNIINQFSTLYYNNNSELFYCNRVDLPTKNADIKDEYCNNKKDFSTLFYILFLIVEILRLFFGKLYKQLQEDLIIRIATDFLNQARRLLDDNNDNCSTDNDESNSNNISFDEENDENIIVENNEVSNVDLNIKDYIENEKKPKLD